MKVCVWGGGEKWSSVLWNVEKNNKLKSIIEWKDASKIQETEKMWSLLEGTFEIK